eukprot:Trichotokara_eunicae@DN6327_c0_g1_i11.p1
MGHQSCHQAMVSHGAGGLGQTVRIINGGYEACPTSPYRYSAVWRVVYYHRLTSVMGVPSSPGCQLHSTDCDVSGAEFLAESDGIIGNPLIGHEQNSTTCPKCAKISCEKGLVSKWVCGSMENPECTDPVSRYDYRCDNIGEIPQRLLREGVGLEVGLKHGEPWVQ